MSTLVRYYSRSGNTKVLAEAIAEAADEYFYAKNKPTESQLSDAKAFAKKFI